MSHALVVVLYAGALASLQFAAGESPTAGSGRVTTSIDAEQLYQKAVRVQDVWWEKGEPGIHLTRRIVVQNDSPGCGRRNDDGGVFEEIPPGTVLSKQLEMAGPVPKRAQLAFIGKERKENASELEVVVNGNVILLRPTRLWAPDAKQYYSEPEDSGPNAWCWSRWHYLEIPGEYLRTGKNRILIRNRGAAPGWSIMVSDYADFHKGCVGAPVFPNASAKSSDGGKTWRQDELGSRSQISGEYVVRLMLDSYRPSGSLSSRVLDVGGEEGVGFKAARTVREVRVRTEFQAAPRTGLATEVRSGDAPVYDPQHWSAWAAPAADGSVPNVRGRYLQWRVTFSTSDPDASPELRRVSVDAQTAAGPKPGRVRIVREQNFELQQAPEGYTYEDFQSAYLKNFREHFNLDAVVAGTRTEWDRQRRLLKWAYLVPLKPVSQRPIFPWDPQNWIDDRRAPDGSLILNRYQNRQREEMCLFPNVILVAALQSFGYPARHINLHSEGMSGHEIAEVWSNQFGKWVYVDATLNLYWFEKATGIPISTLEIHKVLASRLKHVETWQHPFFYTQAAETYLKDLPIAAADKYEPTPVPEDILNWIVTTTAHLRMVPRSDVFSHPSPVPVSQGQEIWCWDNYLDWADSKVPPLEHFSHHTNRESDFNWPVNQVRYVAEETGTPGLISVGLEHNMPNFAALWAKVDGEPWKKVEAHFPWKLHPGENALEVKGQNNAGIEGMTSSLVLDYQPSSK